MAQVNNPPKFCYVCGAVLENTHKFCKNCGKAVRYYEDLANKSTAATNKGHYSPPNKESNPEPNPEFSSFQHETVNRSSTPNPNRSEILNSSDSPQVVTRIDRLEKKIDEIDIKKRFETVEYKINALFGEIHFDQDFKDLAKKINELPSKDELSQETKKLEYKLDNLEKKMKNLARADDVMHLHEKIDTLDLDSLDSKFSNIEKKIENIKPDEKVMNLAKNTVIRLNTLEEKIDNFNLEDRKRLVKIDNKLEDFENKVQTLSQTMAKLVPSLVKLTEKVNQLQRTVSSTAYKSNSIQTLEKFPVSHQSPVDLAPFPGPKEEPQETETKEILSVKKEKKRVGRPPKVTKDVKKGTGPKKGSGPKKGTDKKLLTT